MSQDDTSVQMTCMFINLTASNLKLTQAVQTLSANQASLNELGAQLRRATTHMIIPLSASQKVPSLFPDVELG